MLRFTKAVLAAVALGVAGCSGSGADLSLVGIEPEAASPDSISDAEIELQINHLWASHDLALFRKINLAVRDARAMLTGSVVNPESRVEAVRLAWQVDGVQEVINEVLLDDPSTLLESARDHWIAARLRGRLIVDPSVDSGNYSIDVVRGSVYLMGAARDDAELERVIDHVSEVEYVEAVVNHVHIRPPRQKAGM